MKAIQIKEYGGPEVLQLREVEEPSPQAGKVKIKIYAAGLNPSESYTISGNYAYNVPDLPYVPGYDGTGTIEELGEGVKDFSIGDKVYFTAFDAESNTGSYAEKAVIDAKNVYPLPESFNLLEGAGLGIPSFTAYQALHLKAQVKPGEYVLIHGGSGAVGNLAVQIAKAAGCIVIGTSSTEEGRQGILEAGADFAIDHLSEGKTDALKEFTQGKGPDVIIEFLANKNLEIDSKVIADHGRIVVVGNRGTIEFTPRNLMGNGAWVTGMAFTSPRPEDLRRMVYGINALIETGALKPKIGQIFPLEEASQAHDYLMNSSGSGRTVLKVAED